MPPAIREPEQARHQRLRTVCRRLGRQPRLLCSPHALPPCCRLRCCRLLRFGGLHGGCCGCCGFFGTPGRCLILLPNPLLSFNGRIDLRLRSSDREDCSRVWLMACHNAHVLSLRLLRPNKHKQTRGQSPTALSRQQVERASGSHAPQPQLAAPTSKSVSITLQAGSGCSAQIFRSYCEAPCRTLSQSPRVRHECCMWCGGAGKPKRR